MRLTAITLLAFAPALSALGACSKKAPPAPPVEAAADAVAKAQADGAPATPDASGPTGGEVAPAADTAQAAASDAAVAPAGDATPSADGAGTDTSAADAAVAGDASAGVKKTPRPDAGVLSAAILDELWNMDWGVTDRPSRAADFARAEKCKADHTAEECTIAEGIVATLGERVAVRFPDDAGGCGDWDPAFGYTVGPDGKASDRVKMHIVMGDPSDTPLATHTWLVDIAKQGFKPIESMVLATHMKEAGIRMVQDVVLLGKPLLGWFVETRVLADNSFELALVSPDNQTRHVLGAMPMQKNKGCRGEERKDGMCGDYIEPSIVDVNLAADKATLYVLGYRTDGGHCTSSPSFVKAYPLPKAVMLE